MREILFRAKRIDNGEWIEGQYNQSIKYHFINKPGMAFTEAQMVDPNTVGQYTGLKDKNGIKIFEGDIITKDQYPFIEDGKPNYNGLVELIYGAWEYTLYCVNKDRHGVSDGINHRLDEGDGGTFFEVIGNKFDNSELLTQ